MRTLFLFSLAVIAAMAAPLAAEEPIAAKAEVVSIDVVVTDGDGKPIRDLKKEEFEVLEDGKRQVVHNFVYAGKPASEAAAADAANPAPAPAPPEAAPAPAPTTVPATRNILIVVDDLHIAIDGIENTKKALHRVLDEFVVEGDQVALLNTGTVGVVQAFTRDKAEIGTSIDKLLLQRAAEAQSRTSDLSAVQAEMILSGDRQATQLAGRNLLDEAGSKFDNSTPIAALQSNPGLSQGKEGAAEAEQQRRARGVLEEALHHSVRSLRAMDGALRGLSRLPGRKLCLLISDGFLTGQGTTSDKTAELRRVIDAATRSGTVVYTLDSRGLVTRNRDASVQAGTSLPTQQSSVDRRAEQIFRTTLENIAQQTGGFLVRDTNDLAGGLHRMLEDNASYYLMSYEPINQKRDGKFRKIEVKVTRPGLRVRTRAGYYAPDDRKPVKSAPSPMLLESDVRSLLEAPSLQGAVPVKLNAEFVSLPPAGPQALLRTHVDLARIEWDKQGDRQETTVELLGGLYDAAGKPVGKPFSKRTPLSLEPEQWKRAKEDGLSVNQALPIAAGRYQVRMVARDAQGKSIGGAAEWIDVPDVNSKALALSSIFLSSSAPGATAESEALRAAEANRRFKVGQPVYFQVYVYNPQLDENGANEAVLQAQLRSGDKVIAASKPQPVALQQKDGMPLPETNEIGLAGLPPGPYQLRIVVFDKRANASVNRNVDLTLE
jgi:VWFA-related protein